jgi:putative heme iron utilization protein
MAPPDTRPGIGNDAARIRAAFERNRRKMTVQLARELGVAEVEVIRALPEGMATELDASRWEEMVRAFEPLGDVHVIVTNGAVTLEAFGRFGNFSSFGDGENRYFNVQTKSLDMHIRPSTIGSVFAVEKAGHMDGVNTLSFQFYHRDGSAAFKVFLTFGGSAPPPQRVAQFNALRECFARACEASRG